MILEYLKNKKISPEGLLRVLMGLIFLSAGIFRILNFPGAELELQSLGLSNLLIWPLIILEILGGVALIFKKYLKIVLIVLIIFIVFALVNALWIDGHNLLRSAKELFVFNLNPTDFFLHFVFLIILVSLLMKKKGS